MGSPNFKTNIKSPSFALTSDIINDYDMPFLRDDVQAAINAANDEILFGEIKLLNGYHDGFQIYYEYDDSITEDPGSILEEDFFNTPDVSFLSEDEINSFDGSKFLKLVYTTQGTLTVEDLPAIKNLGEIKIIKDENGENELKFQKNDQAISDFISDIENFALHKLSEIAQEYGLALVIGKTWTQSLGTYEQTQEEIDKHYLPDLFETQESAHKQSFKV